MEIMDILEKNIISARFIITMALVIGYLGGLTTDVTLIGMAIAFWFGSKAATSSPL